MKLISTDNYLRLSIFYNKNLWQNLIREFLRSYVVENQTRLSISSLLIFFNFKQGDNIRLAFICTAEDPNQLADDFHDRLNLFLLNNPSEIVESNKKEMGFFKNFENNSVQYGLYDLWDTELTELHRLISARILNVFSETGYDDSSALSFGIYLIMCFCIEWGACFNEHIDSSILDLLQKEIKIDSLSELDSFFNPYYRLFQENDGLIIDMFTEVIQCENKYNENLDLFPIRKFFRGNFLAASSKISLDQCANIPLAILNQLSLRAELLSAIYYLIQLCFRNSDIKILVKELLL